MLSSSLSRTIFLWVFTAFVSVPAVAQNGKLSAAAPRANTPAKDADQTKASAGNDIPAKFTAPVDEYDYIRREAMIPMRDGVRLYTVILVPKGAKNAPILFTRTPYNATARAARSNSPHLL